MSTISIIGSGGMAERSAALPPRPDTPLRDTGPLLMARTLEYVCLLSLGLIAHSIGHTNFSIGINLITHKEQ